MNISGKYLKVWEVEDKGTMKKVNLGDSVKNKEGGYDNWTWPGCLLVGAAKSVPIAQNDVIEVKSGLIKKRKYQDKWYTDVIIFDLEVMSRSGSQTVGNNQAAAVAAAFEDDIPF